MVEIPRFRKLVKRWPERFLRRIFTGPELAIANDRIESLAARFAAKEAFAKALGAGQTGFSWRDVEILADDAGKPEIRLHGNAEIIAKRLGFNRFLVSLTHTASVSAAVVIATANEATSA